MRRYLLLSFLLVAILPHGAFAVISLTSPTIEYFAVTAGYGGLDANGAPRPGSDPTSDNQANQQQIELVGDPASDMHAFYIGFDNAGGDSDTDGTMFFRVRLAAQNTGGSGEFGGVIRVGFDIDGDGGLDFFANAENSGNLSDITLREAGVGLNQSPSTSDFDNKNTLYSAAQTSSNFLYEGTSVRDGAATDFDGGTDEDYLLTFAIPFLEIVNAASTKTPSFNDQSQFGVVAITSANSQNLNSDFGGINDNNFDPGDSWDDLIGIQDETFSGSSVPEPAAFAMISGLLALFSVAGRRRR